jgi:hypoxanthine phosphoribosyltransferase
MAGDYIYRIFLSYNISGDSNLLLEIIEAVASDFNFKVEIFEPGRSARNPSSAVRELFASGSVEGLLAVIDNEESGWISNEIGMAYAFGLPIYVIANPGVEIKGIVHLITSIKHASTKDRSVLKSSLARGFESLRDEIEQNRKQLPEPPFGSRLAIINWSSYYKLILEAYKSIDVGDVSQQHNRFSPTMILGISRGGIIVADILSRLCRDLTCGLLEADRKSDPPNIFYDDEIAKMLISRHLMELRRHKHKQARILIVDDVVKSGRSLELAIEKVNHTLSQIRIKNCPKVDVKSLALIVQEGNHHFSPDYKILSVPANMMLILPYGLG